MEKKQAQADVEDILLPSVLGLPEEQYKPRRRWKPCSGAAACILIVTSLLYFALGRTMFISRHVAPVDEKISVGGDDWAIPPNITLQNCNGWEKYSDPHRSLAYASFSLPVTADNLMFIVRGLNPGSLRLVGGLASEEEKVKIEVSANFPPEVVLEDYLRVCTINRARGEVGIGFFGRNSELNDRPYIYYEVSIYLPIMRRRSTLQVSKLEMDLVNPDIFISLSSGLVEFNDFVFKSKVLGGIHILQPLRAKHAKFLITDESVNGNFNLTSSFSHEYHLFNGPRDYALAQVLTKSRDANSTFVHEGVLKGEPSLPKGNSSGFFSLEVWSPEIFELNIGFEYPTMCASEGSWVLYPCDEDMNSALNITIPIDFKGEHDSATLQRVPPEWLRDGFDHDALNIDVGFPYSLHVMEGYL